MKKFTYLVIATAALGMVACTGGNKAGYVVTGTVEGVSDGDTVYLQEANGRNLVNSIQPLSQKELLPLKVHKILLSAVISLVKWTENL